MIYDINPGEVTFYNPPVKNSSRPRSFFNLGDDLYFVAKNGNNTNLYRLNGTGTSVANVGYEKNIEKLTVYPNPVKETMNVQSGEHSELTLTDLQGRVVMRKLLKIGDNHLNVNDLSKGIYVGKVRNTASGTISTGKIIIE